MNTNTTRLAAFSDGIMAIIITIVVLEIPTPKVIDTENILALLFNILVFFVTFIVVGSQWIKHHFIFDKCEHVTNKILWLNIIYLFFLSLSPLFTKWIMENPSKIIPAVSYNVLSVAILLSFRALWGTIIKENDEIAKLFNERVKQRNIDNIFFRSKAFRFISTILFVVTLLLFLFVVSFVYPTLTIVFFIILPVGQSIFNLWLDNDILHEKRIVKSSNFYKKNKK